MDSPSLAELDNATKSRAPVTKDSPMRLRMEAMIKEKQQEIIAALEKIDGNKFRQDRWTRPNGGGGISCVLQEGNVFEKAGVNVSVVYGTLPRAAIERMRADHKSFVSANVDSLEFFAAGLSLVLHPHNPMAPTVHLNYRYFETSDPSDPLNGETNWWFGGGTDLTPTYLFPEDAAHFHKTIKAACDRHNPSYYPRFKKWCDKYFYIPHRKESRGVGGIFFDDLDATTMINDSANLALAHNDPASPQSTHLSHPDTTPISSTPLTKPEAQEHLFAFCTDALSSFLPSYLPILQKRAKMPFTPQQKTWQQLRRGRYVEFNLVYDRGTSFGMKTPGARVESILMSLPLTARWEYMHPVSGTGVQEALAELSEGEVAKAVKGLEKEREMIEVLRFPREWA